MSGDEDQKITPRRAITLTSPPDHIAREAHLYHSVFDRAPVGLARVSMDGLFVEANPRLCEIFGHEREALIGRHFCECIHPDDREESREAAERLFAGEFPLYELEKRRQRSDGSYLWVKLSSSLLDDCRLCVFDDISQQKATEEHVELLIRELNHRVKNSLALVQAISEQTLRTVSDLDQFRERFQSRLISLGRAHDILTSTSWEGANLSDILGLTLAPYVANGSTIITEGDPIVLSANAAVLMNMIFHELATNATKYGSLSVPNGRLEVHWHYDDPGDPKAVRLVWREIDGPATYPPQHSGFGKRLIERGAARELGGSARLSFASSGLQCILDLPLSAKVRVAKPTSRNRRRPPRR